MLLTLVLLLSSKNINLLFFLGLFLAGCGVKSDPSPPQESLLPSIESQYMTPEQSSSPLSPSSRDEEQEKKKKKKNIKKAD